nr:TPA_asm: hypothetical protein HUJ06_014493 [Nelumbo nucifera]
MAFMGMGYFEMLLLSLAVVCFIYLRRLSRNDSPLPDWPVLGMLPSLLRNIHHVHDWTTKLLEQSRSYTFTFRGPWLAGMDMVWTCDPANVHYIMSTHFSNFPKGPEFKNIFDVLGDGIFNSDSDLWKTQRKVAHGLISRRRFCRFLERTSRKNVEEGLIPVLDHISEQGMIVDLQDVFQRFTFDSTCTLISGIDPGCLSVEFPDVAFSKALDDVEEAIFFRHIVPKSYWKLQRWLGIGEEKKMSRAWKTLDRYIAHCISLKREELNNRTNKNEEEGIDLLTSYMEDDYGSDWLKSDKLLRDTMLNFMIAGRDTTSAALSWFFWLVAKNPSVETKIREELKSNLPAEEAEKWRVFDAGELSGLAYLHGALCEALRLFPPVPFEHKSPVCPDVLPSGHRVDERTKILFSLYGMGRMEGLWGKDCLEFKPERWITERGRIRHEPSYKFLAFNAGPRTCLGKEVAFTQMKVVAAAFIHNYHVEVIEGHPVSPNLSIILHMKHGLMVRVTKRWEH